MATLCELRDIFALLLQHRPARFGYTEAAFNDETASGIAGVGDFNIARGQNIPGAAYTDYTAQRLDFGLQSRDHSIPMRAWNHFMGRFSFNIGKMAQKLTQLADLLMRRNAHDWYEYDASTAYQAGDVCYQVDGAKQWHVYLCVAACTGHAPNEAAYWTPVTITGEMFTSGRAEFDRLPTGAANTILILRADGESPAYQALLAKDIPDLSADKFTTDRVALDRLPTSGTDATFLVVRTANGSPVYAALLASDIPNIGAGKVTSDRITLDRTPTGSANLILAVRTANGSPVLTTLIAADIPSLDAGAFTEGRFPLDRLPTVNATDKFLISVANGDPVYGNLKASMIPELATDKFTSERFPLDRMPTASEAGVFLKAIDAGASPVYSRLTQSDISDAWLPMLMIGVENLNTADPPAVKGLININGKVYDTGNKLSVEETPVVDKTNYVYAWVDNGVIRLKYAATKPTYDTTRMGWYSGNSRAILKFYYVSTNYNGKVIMYDVNAHLRVNTAQDYDTETYTDLTPTATTITGGKKYTKTLEPGVYYYSIQAGRGGDGGQLLNDNNGGHGHVGQSRDDCFICNLVTGMFEAYVGNDGNDGVNTMHENGADDPDGTGGAGGGAAGGGAGVQLSSNGVAKFTIFCSGGGGGGGARGQHGSKNSSQDDSDGGGGGGGAYGFYEDNWPITIGEGCANSGHKGGGWGGGYTYITNVDNNSTPERGNAGGAGSGDTDIIGADGWDIQSPGGTFASPSGANGITYDDGAGCGGGGSYSYYGYEYPTGKALLDAGTVIQGGNGGGDWHDDQAGGAAVDYGPFIGIVGGGGSGGHSAHGGSGHWSGKSGGSGLKDTTSGCFWIHRVA